MSQSGPADIDAHWREALASVEFTLPSETFEAKLIGACDGTGPTASLESSTHFAIASALQAIATGSDVEQAHRLFHAIAANAERLLKLSLDPAIDLAVLPVDTALHVAFAKTAIEASAPDRETLCLLATTVLDRFAKSKSKNPHVAVLFRLWTAAYAAWLAQNIELLQRIVATRGSIAVFGRQWTLFQAVSKQGTVIEQEGTAFLRVQSETLREEFDALFALHRLPFLAQTEVAMPGERRFGGALIGSYIYSWLQLQTFAAVPTTQSDWPQLRRLMMG